MYSDPSLIRKPVKIFLSGPEAALIDALVGFTGQQKAVLLREMVLEQARLVLRGQADCALPVAMARAPYAGELSASSGAF